MVISPLPMGTFTPMLTFLSCKAERDFLSMPKHPLVEEIE
jgi:hypothetical protein